MNNNDLWDQLLKELQANLKVLPDKPEETAESALKALWFTAAGQPMSAEAAMKKERVELNSEQQKLLQELVNKRISGVPLAHLTGRQQFMGIELIVDPGALIPRKETELLGRTALKILKELSFNNPAPLQVIDVCTGAGNLAVSLALLHPNVKMFASDLSQDAVEIAKENVRMYRLQDRVEIRTGDLLDPFDAPEFYKSADLIICNPPYISSAKVPTMPEEISNYEPSLAFDGGPFGVKILNRLIKEAPKFIKSGGWLAFEVGLGQGKAVRKRLEINAHYGRVAGVADDSGNIRVLMAQRN